jgi:hypothetical protein
VKRLSLPLILIAISIVLVEPARADGQCCTCPEVIWHTNIYCQKSNCMAQIAIYKCTPSTFTSCAKCKSITSYCCGTSYANKIEGDACATPPGTASVGPRDVIFPSPEGGYLPAAGRMSRPSPPPSKSAGATP